MSLREMLTRPSTPPQLLRSKQFTSVRHFNSMDARKLQGLFSGTAFICLMYHGQDSPVV